MKKITFKNIYLILVISIGLIGLGIGSTYAMFTSTSRIDDPISLSSNLTSSTDIFESFDITINSKENKTIKFNITNSSNITNLNYASWYIYEGNESDITFYTSIDNTNDIEPNGILPSSGGTINIKIINNTSNTINLTIGVITNKDNIVLPEYMKLISSNNEPKTTLVDYITNLYNNTEKSYVENNSIIYIYAASASLMNDRLGSNTTNIADGNIRYYGANPNNYIYFNCETYPSTNCELWRIIGVFDGKVKIMRNESIGKYSWDISTSSVNSGYGVNEWSEADLMKLLNPGYESETIGNSHYISGSLYYNSSSGAYYSDGSSSTIKLLDFTTTGIKNDTTRNKIASVMWNTGGWNTTAIYSDAIYRQERGTKVISSPGDGITRKTSWTGKIALPYPSDYGYATDLSKCSNTITNYNSSTDSYACRSNDWMFPILGTSSGGWLLTPTSNFAYKAFSVVSGSVSYSYNVHVEYSVIPTLYLSSDATILEGTTGTEDNPYKLN